VDSGIDMIQVREPDMDARDLLDLVVHVVELARGSSTRVLVNDRLDVALAARADGVHLPANGLPPAAVRALVDLVGVSTHSIEEIRSAEAGGADFAVFGPVFETPGKTGVGLEKLREAVRATGIPVFAIGGMSMTNAGQAIGAGAAGIAGIRLFQS
jgi:thiamine-phosphate pyrophosphorylase